MAFIFFEQFSLGQHFITSSYRITKEEIIEYALRYSPLYIHIHEEKAKDGIFNGLVASGLNTMSIAMKLFVELDLLGNEFICGVSIDKGRFIRPVYPEDVLSAKVKIIGLSSHLRDSDRGYVAFKVELNNQHGQIVLNFNTKAIVKKRETQD